MQREPDWVHAKCETYPGMAKDIGDLFPRVNKIEQLLKDYPLKTLYERQVAYRLERLESDSKQDREIEGLVQKHLMDDSRLNSQENHIDRVETALKALQEEIRTLKNNQILLKYDPTPRTFTTSTAIDTAHAGAYNPCVGCMRLLQYRQQLAAGGGPISAAMQNPCYNCPTKPNIPTCSK
jgi:hypothetical protein